MAGGDNFEGGAESCQRTRALWLALDGLGGAVGEVGARKPIKNEEGWDDDVDA